MRIEMQCSLIVPTKDGQCIEHKPGAVISVYHRVGRRLIMAHSAKWVSPEPGDPAWTPVPFLRAAIPQRDKMSRGAYNKGAA
jgi:hypothetical protein